MDDVTSGVTDLNWFNILIIFGRNLLECYSIIFVGAEA